MAVLESTPHALTVRTGSEKWGCNNRVWAKAYMLHQRVYTDDGAYYMTPKEIKHTMSTECRQANTMIDVRCDGCRERGLGDAYVEKIRREGK